MDPEFHSSSSALSYWLHQKGVNAYQLSKETLIPQSRISEILAGKRRISTETATILGHYFETGVEYWLHIQSRDDIRKNAANANVLHYDCRGEFSVGGWKLQCFVLPDGRSVVSAVDFCRMFGINSAVTGPNKIASFIVSPALMSAKMDQLREEISKPLPVLQRDQSVALCYNGDAIIEYCRALLDIRRVTKEMPENLAKYAVMAEIIISSVAKVGIVALIHEATGFQARRHKEALQRILDGYFREEWAKWSKKFPDWFYEEMFRLKGWKWAALSSKRPPYVGKITKDIVYSRLEPGVLTQLERLNPQDEDGKRPRKHHQWLSEDVGHPALDAHFYALRGLYRMHQKWDKFYHALQLAFPQRNEAVQLELSDFSDDCSPPES